MGTDRGPYEPIPPTYTDRELLAELADLALVAGHHLINDQRGDMCRRHGRVLVDFILSEVNPQLGDDALLHSCPVCGTNVDDVTIAATSDAHRAHLTDEEADALNDAYANSWKKDR